MSRARLHRLIFSHVVNFSKDTHTHPQTFSSIQVILNLSTKQIELTLIL